MKRITILMIAGILFPYILHAQSQEKKDFGTMNVHGFFSKNIKKDGYSYVYAQKDALKDLSKDVISTKIIDEFDEIDFVKVLTYNGYLDDSQIQTLNSFRRILAAFDYELLMEIKDGKDISIIYKKAVSGKNHFEKIFINSNGNSLTYIWVSGTIAKE